MWAYDSEFPCSDDQHMCESCFRTLPYSSPGDIFTSFASNPCLRVGTDQRLSPMQKLGPGSHLSDSQALTDTPFTLLDKGQQSCKHRSLKRCIGRALPHTGAPCSRAFHQPLYQESKGCPTGTKATIGALWQPFPSPLGAQRWKEYKSKRACAFLNLSAVFTQRLSGTASVCRSVPSRANLGVLLSGSRIRI